MCTYQEEAINLQCWCGELGGTDMLTNHLCSELGEIGAILRRMRQARRRRRMPLLLGKAIKRWNRKSRPARLQEEVLKNRRANRDKGRSCVC